MSRGTVSRVLNGGHHVSASALAKVNKAMSDTHYVANHSAQTLASGRANAVAFVLTEPQERLFEDPNFNVLLRAATQALSDQAIALVLLLAGPSRARGRVLHFIRSGHVDGLMLISPHRGDPIVSELEALGLPIVACARPLGAHSGIPYVAADDREGARLMTRYLLESGRRKVGMITGPLDTPGGIDRLDGYREVMGSKARKQLIVSASEYTHEAGEAAMRRLLGQAPDIDAAFVASDLLAAGALVHVQEAGRTVPHDIAIGGFDDSQIATTTRPQLTTIRQPLGDVAAEMVDVLMARIRGRQVSSSRVLPVSLVRRGSA